MTDFAPQFWLVWREDGGSPTHKHPSFTAAKAEAQRLARCHPGSRFVVLPAVTAYVKRDVDEIKFDPGTWMDGPRFAPDCEIPF